VIVHEFKVKILKRFEHGDYNDEDAEVEDLLRYDSIDSNFFNSDEPSSNDDPTNGIQYRNSFDEQKKKCASNKNFHLFDKKETSAFNNEKKGLFRMHSDMQKSFKSFNYFCY
jgi:hypothetical protein